MDEDLKRAIEDLHVVSSLRCHAADAKNKAGYHVNLRCGCGAKQVAAPPDVSVCKGIMSCFSFLFLGVPRHYAKRPFNCWCQACSRVRGRGLGSQSSDPHLLVSDCTRTKQTAWIEDQFTVTSSPICVNSHKSPSESTLSPTLSGCCSICTSLLN